LEAQGEQLLQNLVDHEQRLVARVEEARKQAAEIVKEAEIKAVSILASAKDRADRLAKDQAERTQAEGEAARQTIVQSAQREVDRIRERTGRNRRQAVALVLERVLP
jgi:V/A-type H+-transporting ATPase subunit G/H